MNGIFNQLPKSLLQNPGLLEDLDLLKAKQTQIEKSLEKFKKYFEDNYLKLKQWEHLLETSLEAAISEDPSAPEGTHSQGAPPFFHFCFNDLAHLLGLDQKKSVSEYLRKQRNWGRRPAEMVAQNDQDFRTVSNIGDCLSLFNRTSVSMGELGGRASPSLSKSPAKISQNKQKQTPSSLLSKSQKIRDRVLPLETSSGRNSQESRLLLQRTLNDVH